MKKTLVLAATLTACGLVLGQVSSSAQRVPDAGPDEAGLWLAHRLGHSPSAVLGEAVEDLAEGRAARALPVFTKFTNDATIGNYALIYVGRTQMALGRLAEAATAARQAVGRARTPQGREAAYWLMADVAEARADWREAVQAFDEILQGASTRPAQAHLRSGRASLRAGDRTAALRSFSRVFYEFPLAPEAAEATDEMTRLAPGEPPAPSDPALVLGRATLLYGARRYADARKAFDRVASGGTPPERALAELRMAQCDFHLKKYAAAREALGVYLARAKDRVTEAQLYYLGTLRELGRRDEYVAGVRLFVDANAKDPLAEQALNELGTAYILASDDEKAAAVFLEMYDRYPTGAFADRAAWKAGWWAYRNRDFATVVRLFESAAVTFRRADYRPSWLYWAARARAQMGDRARALELFDRTITDYRNSYYGREAVRQAERLVASDRPATSRGVVPARASSAPAPAASPVAFVGGDAPPNTAVVRALLSAELYDEAIAELRRSQRDVASSPMLEATLAFAMNRKGELRPGITGMRRAYPQFMAEGGEALPRELLTVIFPLDYWDVIHKYATARKLDPFLMAALVSQESTFQADVRSVANAWGLMQIIPGTGRRYATKLAIRPFSVDRLTDPDVNVRIGMAYFADLLGEFRDAASALAAYNAGESRVRRWRAERPGIDRDEFIDDIPFPETQNYVKRILGTAEDYRLLYRDHPPTSRTSAGH